MWCHPLTGALMFSTDGRRVYRTDGSVMPGAAQLRGGPSSSQSALILPDPTFRRVEECTRFYVFCIGDLSSRPEDDDSALTMNVVDFSVDPAGVITQSNVVVAEGMAEKLVATQHCDGQNIWLVVHAKEHPTFYAYKLTKDGLEPPVISRVGAAYVPSVRNVRGGAYGQGLMAFSRDGTKLAMAVPFSYRTEVFDFNLYTGAVTNPVMLDTVSRNYGVCFSPSGSLLYTVEWVAGNSPGPVVRQYDVRGVSQPILIGTLADNNRDHELGGIQQGPDGSLWLAESFGLARIASPNVPGVGCQFRSRFLGFQAPARIIVGLPNLVTSMLDNSLREVCAPPIVVMDFDTVVCQGDSAIYTDLSKNKPTTWEWTFEGGEPASFFGKVPPPIWYLQEGHYRVVLRVSNQYGADSAEYRIHVQGAPSISAGNSIVLCDSAAGTLHASGGVRYEWEYKPGIGNRLSANPVVRVFQHTQFVVRGWSEDGCSATDTVWVYAYPQGKPPLTLMVIAEANLAGTTATVTVVKGSGISSGPFDVELALPNVAFYGPVVLRGTHVSTVASNAQHTLVRIQPDANSDTLAVVEALLLLFEGEEEVTVRGIPTDDCDTFFEVADSVTSNSCASEKRVVRYGSQPMAIVAILADGRTVHVQGNPRAYMELSAWDLQGRLLSSTSFGMTGRWMAVQLPEAVQGQVLLKLQSGADISTRLCVIN